MDLGSIAGWEMSGAGVRENEMTVSLCPFFDEQKTAFSACYHCSAMLHQKGVVRQFEDYNYLPRTSSLAQG